MDSHIMSQIMDIAGTFKVSNSTATKVYKAVMLGADAASVYAIIVAAVGPLAIGAAVVLYLIKKKVKVLAASAAIAW